MLYHLRVKNLALIDSAEVEFGDGLNILTGENGSRKIDHHRFGPRSRWAEKHRKEMIRRGCVQRLH